MVPSSQATDPEYGDNKITCAQTLMRSFGSEASRYIWFPRRNARMDKRNPMATRDAFLRNLIRQYRHESLARGRRQQREVVGEPMISYASFDPVACMAASCGAKLPKRPETRLQTRVSLRPAVNKIATLAYFARATVGMACIQSGCAGAALLGEPRQGRKA